MAKIVFRVVWIAVWITVATSAVIPKDNTPLPGQQFFQTLPENERSYYLSFELSRGYTERASVIETRQLVEDEIVFPDSLNIAKELVEKFKALDVPTNFTQNLFNLVRFQFHLNNSNIRTLILFSRICFENGECIDLNDVGAICCPF